MIHGDPIYANAHAASLSLVEALQDTHVTTVQIQAPFSHNNNSLYSNNQMMDGDRIQEEDRHRFLPAYKEPPDYETYMKKKYAFHGSLPYIPVSQSDAFADIRCNFSSMQHHHYNHNQQPLHHQTHLNGNYVLSNPYRVYPTHSQSHQVLPQSRDFEMHNNVGSLPYLPFKTAYNRN